MINNEQFLEIIKQSFSTYLSVGTSRSTAKLKILHGSIAADLKEKLGNGFSIQSQGYEEGIEGSIDGRYYSKKTDITVKYNNKAVAGYAVKFVMRNYFQNSNNYFENMLGETANIRASGIPYFQIFIIFDKVPYYQKSGKFSRYDAISQHNLQKYIELSADNPKVFLHTPDKTLFTILSLKERAENDDFIDENDYANYYSSVIDNADLLTYSNKIDVNFKDSVILNDYKKFIEETCNIILDKIKTKKD